MGGSGAAATSRGDSAAAALLVFGLAPTLQEANEAILDLRDALRFCFSNEEAGCLMTTSGFGSSSSLQISAATSAAAPNTNHAVFQAFALLENSPQVQNAVASVASDPNVFDAVLKNPHGFFKRVKGRAWEMMSRLLEHLQHHVGGGGGGGGTNNNSRRTEMPSPCCSSSSVVIGETLQALTVAVLFVILFKRAPLSPASAG